MNAPGGIAEAAVTGLMAVLAALLLLTPFALVLSGVVLAFRRRVSTNFKRGLRWYWSAFLLVEAIALAVALTLAATDTPQGLPEGAPSLFSRTMAMLFWLHFFHIARMLS